MSRAYLSLLLALSAVTLIACDDGETTTTGGTETPVAGMDTPVAGMDTPVAGMDTPVAGMDTPVAGMDTPVAGMDTPVAGTEPPVMGMLSCIEIVECMGACADQACAEACVTSGSPEGQQVFLAVNQCLQGSGCAQDDQQCIVDACSDQLIACQGGTTPPPMGDMSCAETLFCAGNCPEGDQACQQSCISGISAAEAPALQAYAQCLNDNMCMDEACVQTNCQAEYEGCIPPGTAGCNETLTCASMCTTEECAFNCQINADAEGLELFGAFADCFNANGCMNPADCAACEAEYGACQAD